MSSAPIKEGAGGDPRSRIDGGDLRKLLEAALGYADRGREVVSQALEHGVDVDAKPDQSLVTSADLAAERAFRQGVAQDFPRMGVIGEEFEPSRPDAEYQWIIDPVDGTSEFARGLPTWGSIIGVFLNADPLVGVIDHPALDLRVHAAHGLGAFANGERLRLEDLEPQVGDEAVCIGLPSRSNFMRGRDDGHVFDALARAHPDFRVIRTCLTHTYAATGQLDAAVEWDTNIWDLAATRIVVEEAGGRYLCVRQREEPGKGTLYSAVFGRPVLVERMAAMLAALI